MKDISWDMNARTIVRKVQHTPAQTTLPDPSLEKVKQGERMRFDAHVNVETLPEGMHLKKATIFSNVPNGGTWELISDEGLAVGGRGTAPSPLMYFAAGLGLCMMSHVEMLAKDQQFRITGARLEQRSTWSTTMDLGHMSPANCYGKGEHMQLNLVIESPETDTRMTEFTRYCRQACMALQTVAAATPVATGLYLNGLPLGDVGGFGPYQEL